MKGRTRWSLQIVAFGAALAFLPFVGAAQPRGAGAPSPRPLAPLSGARVDTLRPTFRVALPAGADPTVLELCADRACTRPHTTIPVEAPEITAASDLTPGVVFWRLRSTRVAEPAVSATWVLRVRRPRAASVAASTSAVGADVFVGSSWTRGQAALQRVAEPEVRRPAVSPDETRIERVGVFGRPPALVSTEARSARIATGDFDGDGRTDIAIGTPDYERGAIRVTRAAAATPDAPIGFPERSPPRHPMPRDHLGAVLAVGDADGDGYDDLAAQRAEVGLRSSGPIVVLLYRGGPNGLASAHASRIQSPRPAPDTRTPPRAPTTFATSLAFADMDADGHDDLAIGSPSVLRIYRGTPAGLGAPAAWEIAPPAGASFDEMRVTRAGDTNGDGYEDLAVTVRSTAGPFGRVLVYLGSRSGPRAEPVALSAGEVPVGFGAAVAAAGDVDGDGRGELLVSFSGGEARREAGVYLYRGTDDGPDARGGALLDGPREAAVMFGAALAGGRDDNGDGYADVIVGAPGLDRGRGAIHLFRGGSSPFADPAVVARGRRVGYGFGALLAW